MAKFGFDVTEVEVSERGDFEVMPEGEYTLKATEAEMKNTKAGDGKYLAVTFEVVKGEHAGRKVWQNFNIFNPNDKAEKIGREQVAGWARACGKPNASDSDTLLERSFQCVLKVEKGSGGYSDKNQIKSFLTSGNDAGTEKPASKKASEKAEVEKDDSPAPSAKKNPWD